MKLRIIAMMIALAGLVSGVRAGGLMRPEGWVTCSTVTSAGDYDLTGGGDGPLIVLRSDGTDMGPAIAEAVNSHDVVVLDGSMGDFMFGSNINLHSLSGKTIIGVNGARLCTEFSVTQEIRDLLDDLDVKSLSQNASDNLGGTLSNGVYVAEQCELTIRQALIDRFGDEKEPYRYAGILALYGCSDFIIRNLDFAGPGSLDVGGADLLTLSGCDHVWVDHCLFTDGLDGNLDIVNNCDFITVSDTRFRYTEKAYNHPLSNLNSGEEMTDGSAQRNNISWIRCYWDEGCSGRMPYTVLGIHHILNCYWDCTGGTCIDAHKQSRLLIENSVFTSKVKRALAVRDADVVYDWRGSLWHGKSAPLSNGHVEVPYDCMIAEAAVVPEVVAGAGATLPEPFVRELSASPSMIDFGKVYAGVAVEGKFTVSGFEAEVAPMVTLSAPEGVEISADGKDFSSSLMVEATDGNLLQADVYVRARFSGRGVTEIKVDVSSPDGDFAILLRADVVELAGEGAPAVVSWPLDAGASGSTVAVAEPADAFGMTAVNVGENLYVYSGQTIAGRKFTCFNPTEASGRARDEECYVEFDLEAAADVEFVPESLTFNAARVGTDMCFVDVVAIRDGFETELLNGFQPERSSGAPAFSAVELPLGNTGVGRGLKIRIYLYYMTANKQLALGDVKISGKVYHGASGIAETCGESGSTVATEYYDLMGRKVLHPQRGRVYIECSSNGSTITVIYR